MYVYVWHAITGYWGGVRPGIVGMEHYESKMQHPMLSPGVQKKEPCAWWWVQSPDIAVFNTLLFLLQFKKERSCESII